MSTSYEEIKRFATIEKRDRYSGHLWKWEIDLINHVAKVYKNGELKREINYTVSSVSDSYLEELKEGL